MKVSTCANKTISGIISGIYHPHAKNHDKVVYKKAGKSNELEVLIYFWDQRDGDDLFGWWFGPTVGGDQVWAHHPSRMAATPPSTDWNVPHDGAIDKSFSVMAHWPTRESGSTKSAEKEEEEEEDSEEDNEEKEKDDDDDEENEDEASEPPVKDKKKKKGAKSGKNKSKKSRREDKMTTMRINHQLARQRARRLLRLKGMRTTKTNTRRD